MSNRTTSVLAVSLIVFGIAGPAFADSCEKSRDYILGGLAGDLPKPGTTYQDLFKVCQEVLSLPNVKDAYVLKAGAIAVDPKRNTVAATAATLAQFCERFPQRLIRFLTPLEQRQARTVGLVVLMTGGKATSCAKLGAS